MKTHEDPSNPIEINHVNPFTSQSTNFFSGPAKKQRAHPDPKNPGQSSPSTKFQDPKMEVR
jgi:hypothetical protein